MWREKNRKGEGGCEIVRNWEMKRREGRREEEGGRRREEIGK